MDNILYFKFLEKHSKFFLFKFKWIILTCIKYEYPIQLNTAFLSFLSIPNFKKLSVKVYKVKWRLIDEFYPSCLNSCPFLSLSTFKSKPQWSLQVKITVVLLSF